MSNRNPSHDGSIDRSTFNRALEDLVTRAVSADVDIEGGYRIDGLDSDFEYGVEILRVVSTS